eukprot:363366_1
MVMGVMVIEELSLEIGLSLNTIKTKIYSVSVSTQLPTRKIIIIKLIQKVHRICYALYDRYKINIVFQWNKRNSNYGIIRADALAKEAAQKAMININQNWIQPICKKEIIKNVLSQIRSEDRWNKIEQLKPTHFLAANLWKWKDHIYIHYDAILEAEYLLSIQIQILYQLRSGYLETNYVKHIINHLKHYSLIENQTTNLIACHTCCKNINNGLCIKCNQNDTIEHVVLNCTKFIEPRLEMLYTIMPIYNKVNIDFNLCNLLFVPNNIGSTKKKRWSHRKMIYTALCKYIIKTRTWTFH